MDDTGKFYRAVAEYLEAKGGKAIVVGGVSVESAGREHIYRLVIEFTGKAPTPPSEDA